MRFSTCLLILACLSCSAFVPAVGQSGSSATPAKSLRVVAGEIESSLSFKPSDETDSDAPRFVALWQRQMPTPGWTFEIDDTQVEGHRIIVRMTEVAPSGMSAQVMTRTTVKVAIGAVPRGRYVLEIQSRRDGSKPHQPVYAAIVNAY